MATKATRATATKATKATQATATKATDKATDKATARAMATQAMGTTQPMESIMVTREGPPACLTLLALHLQDQ